MALPPSPPPSPLAPFQPSPPSPPPQADLGWHACPCQQCVQGCCLWLARALEPPLQQTANSGNRHRQHIQVRESQRQTACHLSLLCDEPLE